MDREPPSPLIPSADILKGPDHAPNQPQSVERDQGAMVRPWSHDVGESKLEFLIDGPDRYEALLTMIEGAQHSLRLLYYMFKNDSAGQEVMDALKRALDRGVAVTLIIDSFGSGETPDSFFTGFKKAGGHYYVFSTKWRPTYLIRNHQKLLIADETSLLTGGFNIADDYFAPLNDIRSWHDLGVSIKGPAVPPMVDYFDKIHHWVSERSSNWKSLRLLIHTWDRTDPEQVRAKLAYSSASRQQGPLKWLIGGPTRRLNPMVKAMKADLDVGQRLDMVEAYFAPGRGMLRRIGRMALQRKGARLILPSKSDNGATIGAARILYGYLLKRRVRIYEFAPKKLHMKLIVIDDITYIGTANFDMRSLFTNMELMLRIEDAGLSQKMRDLIDVHADHSDVITRLEHKRQLTFINRLRWSLAYFIVAIMDYGVTRRLNFGIGG